MLEGVFCNLAAISSGEKLSGSWQLVCVPFILHANVLHFAFQKTFKDEELLPLQLVLKKLDLISELRER